ncbi:MAG: inorganic phosphate transporter [Chloroflexi bacterium]|nr:inorganic phosphate transporter [Chloroflexota bacterium]
MDGVTLLVLIVVLGLIFEYVNGFHDAANAIATIVATRVLRPQEAVIMAGVLNFLGALSGTAVATTVGKGIVDPNAINNVTVIAALISAIIWDLVTWRYGIPSSSSHALIFSVVGAGVATGGPGVLVWDGLGKSTMGILYSPLFGMAGGVIIMLALYWIFRRSSSGRVSAIFGRAQLLSAAYMAFSHGSNDGQKTMGIISLALFSAGVLGPTFYIPLWVMILAALAIALGTAMGGWRIIKTMGFGLANLRPVQGFAAEMSAATVIEVATRMGIPVSTTHAITGSILGVGSAHRVNSVRWGLAERIVTAWVLTIPACFALGFALRLAAAAFGA